MSDNKTINITISDNPAVTIMNSTAAIKNVRKN